MEFSVLMAVYKNDIPNEVDNAICSVLNQTLSPKEVVIVVDGPIPQKLDELLNDYSLNSKFNIIRLRENGGLGNALKIGIQHCSSEYVARMDSDDFSVPERFEKQVRYLKCHPETDVIGGQIAEYDKELKNRIATRVVPLEMVDIKNRIRSRNPMNHVTVMYRKSAVIDAGNYATCLYFEDYYLWCRMLKNGCVFHNLDDVLVNVRTGDDMYKRRGGSTYNNAIVDFQHRIQKLGVISKGDMIKNIMIRVCVANMPNVLRGYLYQHQLRQNLMK